MWLPGGVCVCFCVTFGTGRCVCVPCMHVHVLFETTLFACAHTHTRVLCSPPHPPNHNTDIHTMTGIRVDAKTYLAGVQKQAEQDKVHALER